MLVTCPSELLQTKLRIQRHIQLRYLFDLEIGCSDWQLYKEIFSYIKRSIFIKWDWEKPFWDNFELMVLTWLENDNFNVTPTEINKYYFCVTSSPFQILFFITTWHIIYKIVLETRLTWILIFLSLFSEM